MKIDWQQSYHTERRKLEMVCASLRNLAPSLTPRQVEHINRILKAAGKAPAETPGTTVE